VTNIRGLDSARLSEFVGHDVTVEWLGLEDSESRKQWGLWFTWVPVGALLLVDEAQVVWPKTWTARQVSALVFPGGPEKAAEAGRPASFAEGFEMHRHFGFDLVLTTQDVSRIRPEIKAVAEAFYRHKNLATVGIKGRFTEQRVEPDTGTVLSQRTRKIPKQAFDVYQSTREGVEAEDTSAAQPWWRIPGLFPLVLTIVGASCVVLFLFIGGHFNVADKALSEAESVSSRAVRPQVDNSTDSVLSAPPGREDVRYSSSDAIGTAPLSSLVGRPVRVQMIRGVRPEWFQVGRCKSQGGEEKLVDGGPSLSSSKEGSRVGESMGIGPPAPIACGAAVVHRRTLERLYNCTFLRGWRRNFIALYACGQETEKSLFFVTDGVFGFDPSGEGL
jgi:hypothetical protein